ncbi:cytochrome P450 [Saccharothrix sp. NRRL B-16348]|uniref:cytochrome P450 n=1 Tax=Saccharothrix sp. NRRL B-16348 TaxID=1415542 RepID=UPI0006AE8CB6|nr:cytochrome P450 [Saccharothrix sp. NRRL B-16348]
MTARRPARASLVDTVALGALVFVPTFAQGPILRRRRMVGLAARWDTNDWACRLLRRLRGKHGTGPLLVKVLHRRVLLLLSPRDARQALEQTTVSLTAASRDKVAALGHFEPGAVLLSRGLVRQDRRRFNESVLDYPGTDHRLCPEFDAVIRAEAATLISRTTGRGAELTWDEFVRTYRRIVRRVVLGDVAEDDERLTALLNGLRADANWFRLRPRRHAVREQLWERVLGYLDEGSGGLAACVADAPRTARTLPQAQAQHWLFAFDAAPIATYLALGLLAGHPEKSRTDHDYLRACVRESLRLWPTTLAILRDTTRRTTWSDGSTVPVGTAVVYYSSYFHRDDSRLPYADRFEPEVWLDGRAAEDWALAPFSRGPAECPGQHVVLFTSATLLSALLDQGLRQVGGVRLTPDAPLPRTADHHALRFA